MRLIDADELLNGLIFPTKQFEKAFTELINDAPTVDAKPRVRCKDCKWWDNHDGGERCINTVHLSWAKPENFCNYAERKESEE